MDPLTHTHETQQAYRRRLIETWKIPQGARLLEIGCGQGDTTEALALSVGPDGHVLGVDIAPPTYGSPLTLGEATALLKAGELGDRMSFRFGVDITDSSVEFPEAPFDGVVLSHCSWYFASVDQLRETLVRLRSLSARLYFAEWDLAVESPDQIPHWLAVMVQGLVEASNPDSQANVRTPLASSQMRDLLRGGGWTIAEEQRIDTSGLEDADWEIGMARRLSDNDFERLPVALRTFARTQLALIAEVAKPKGNRPLGAYALLAAHR